MAFNKNQRIALFVGLVCLLTACKKPDQDIQLKMVRDVVADATEDPVLRGEAVFMNPNNISGRLKYVEVDIFVNGKKAGSVKKDYKIRIPARGEFTVPIEVKLNMKELGTLNTIMGMLGGRKFEVRYEGKLKLSYHGLPVSVPIRHTSDVKVRF